MNILLHGDNIVASRDRLTQLKEMGPVIEVALDDQAPQITSLFAADATIVIWTDKKLAATQIKEQTKKFPDLKIEEFKLDPVVFKFLDALYPSHQQIFMPLWQKYLTREEPEVAFVMLVRQFRLMLNPKDPDLISWQRRKIESQAKAFGSKAPKIYQKLLSIDYQVKSGQSPLDLKTSLDLLLLAL